MVGRPEGSSRGACWGGSRGRRCCPGGRRGRRIGPGIVVLAAGRSPWSTMGARVRAGSPRPARLCVGARGEGPQPRRCAWRGLARRGGGPATSDGSVWWTNCTSPMALRRSLMETEFGGRALGSWALAFRAATRRVSLSVRAAVSRMIWAGRENSLASPTMWPSVSSQETLPVAVRWPKSRQPVRPSRRPQQSLLSASGM